MKSGLLLINVIKMISLKQETSPIDQSNVFLSFIKKPFCICSLFYNCNVPIKINTQKRELKFKF